MLAIAAWIVMSYVLGSVPFGLLLGLLRGVDIRRTGSGNIGATNLGRTLGKRWAVLCFALDFGKGLLPVLLVRAYGEPTESLSRVDLEVLSGTAAIIGHVAPAWLGFRGGKGVATAFGVMAALAWIASLAAGVAWFIAFRVTRAVSVASLVAAVVFPAATVALHFTRPPPRETSAIWFAVGIAALIVLRHRENIRRLLEGEEHRFGSPSAADPPAATEPRPGPEAVPGAEHGSGAEHGPGTEHGSGAEHGSVTQSETEGS